MFERLRVTSGQPRPSRLRQELANLYPGYFALVMATGIVSAGLIRAWPAASAMLLAVALAGFAVLTLLFGVRAALFPTRFVADLSSADRVFGFFTIVAAADVLALRADQQRWPQVSIGFAIVGAVTWALLTYAVPVLLVTRARHDSVNRTADGSWLLWVVATQSVAAVSAALAGEGRWWGALADGAVILWSVGTVLYLVLVTVVGAQLLVEGLRPGEFTPPFWILMGAAAISVLAGALISRLPGPDPMVSMALPLVSGMSLVLWAFASWWIPLLIVLQLWRCAGRGRRLRYAPDQWAIVFPLGMYAVATGSLGTTMRVGFMAELSDVATWVALVAWFTVFLGLAVTRFGSQWPLNGRALVGR